MVVATRTMGTDVDAAPGQPKASAAQAAILSEEEIEMLTRDDPWQAPQVLIIEAVRDGRRPELEEL